MSVLGPLPTCVTEKLNHKQPNSIFKIEKQQNLTNNNDKMAGFMDKIKNAGKNVVDAGAKTMLKVRKRELWEQPMGIQSSNDDSIENGSK